MIPLPDDPRVVRLHHTLHHLFGEVTADHYPYTRHLRAVPDPPPWPDAPQWPAAWAEEVSRIVSGS